MPLKDLALLMTVGTGIGSDKKDSLAHGLLFSIINNHPKKIIFFGSDDSKSTIESLKRQYLEKFGEILNYYEFIKIDEIDDFSKYFTEIKSKIHELEDKYEITIDYTSGTKTMTMAAAFASMLCGKNLIFISGKRENGIVVKGTEKIISQNLYLVYDDLIIKNIKELFNNNRFEVGKTLLDDITDNDKESYIKLLDSYRAFDNVDYNSALENFCIKEFSNKWPSLTKDFQNNIKALNILNDENHKFNSYYNLASLLNNARRRFEENKYDDAIARLYRSLELIAQIKLQEYNIQTGNVDINILKDFELDKEYINNLENTRDDKSNKIRIGLTQDYVLLDKLDDEIGKFYNDNEKLIQNCLKFRNDSILAHGLNSLNKDQYLKFQNLVKKAAIVLNEDIDNFISETTFPQFDM